MQQILSRARNRFEIRMTVDLVVILDPVAGWSFSYDDSGPCRTQLHSVVIITPCSTV